MAMMNATFFLMKAPLFFQGERKNKEKKRETIPLKRSVCNERSQA